MLLLFKIIVLIAVLVILTLPALIINFILWFFGIERKLLLRILRYRIGFTLLFFFITPAVPEAFRNWINLDHHSRVTTFVIWGLLLFIPVFFYVLKIINNSYNDKRIQVILEILFMFHEVLFGIYIGINVAIMPVLV